MTATNPSGLLGATVRASVSTFADVNAFTLCIANLVDSCSSCSSCPTNPALRRQIAVFPVKTFGLLS